MTTCIARGGKLLLAFLLFAAPAFAQQGGYLFVHFKNGGASPLIEQIYFGLSQDGLHWTALNESKPVLVSSLGTKGVRDPFLLRSHDGTHFYLLATDLSVYYNGNWTAAQQQGSHSIVIWESSDLVHWSQPRLMPVAASDAGCTWAPEAIYDESAGNYLVFWASTSASDKYAKQRIWACRTTDFHSFGTPFIYIERAHHVIDADIVKDGTNFYRFTKDETLSTITMEASSALMGPWTNVAGFSTTTLATVTGYEGPECYQLPSGAWCLSADHIGTSSGYTPFIASSIASGSFAATSNYSFPYLFRHGSVLAITAAEYARVAAAFQSSSHLQTHLPFNESSGTSAADASGHAWNGSLLNGASFADGKAGKAVSLSGSAYVSLPPGISYSLTDFTISAWVKPNSTSANMRVFDFGTSTPPSQTTGAYVFLTPNDGAGKVRFAITTAGWGSEQTISGSSALSPQVWSHVAVTLSGSLAILYVNGSEVARKSDLSLNPLALGVTTQNWLGRSQYSADPYLNGLIDDFRIYTAGLSADSIMALYNGTAGGRPSPWLDQDLGTPSLAGATSSEDANLVVTASGTGIQGTSDQGHFTYQSWTGDGIFNVRLNTVSANAVSTASAGIMFRDGQAASAPCVFLGVTQAGTLTWQHRDSSGGPTIATASTTNPVSPWLRVARYGNVFTAFVSTDGTNFTHVGSPVTVALAQTLNVGLAMSSGSSSAVEVANFSNATLSNPAPAVPAGLTAAQSGTCIDLSWNSVLGASSYSLKRSGSANGPFAAIGTSTPSTNYTDAPTADGSTFYYVVSAIGSGGTSADSAPISVTAYSDFQQWKLASGLSAGIADTAPGTDGMPVLLKYCLGYAAGATGKAPFSPTQTPKGATFTRLSPAPANFLLQGSTDLVVWTDLAALAFGSDTWTGTATVVEDTSTTPRKVTVLDDPSFSAAPKRFYRLRVQRPVP